MTRYILFTVGTFFFLLISRRSLFNPGTHGFYRFFVFEGVLALVLMNHPYWFDNPFSPFNLLSWFLLANSIFFIIHALLLFKTRGGRAERKDMPENFSFENTTNIVENGLYHYIRHPMYSSLLFLGWGAFLKHVTPITIMLVLLVSIILIAVARVEERENIRFFGSSYEAYIRRTKMFIPWIL